MKKLFRILLFLHPLLYSEVTAQIQYTYIDTKSKLKPSSLNIADKGCVAIKEGVLLPNYLISFKRIRKDKIYNVSKDLEITGTYKIPKKVNGRKSNDRAYYYFDDKIIVFDHYRKKGEMLYGYYIISYENDKWEFNPTFNVLKSQKAKLWTFYYTHDITLYPDKDRMLMYLIKHKGYKTHFFDGLIMKFICPIFIFPPFSRLVVSGVTSSQELWVFDKEMNSLMHDRNFKLKARPEDEMNKRYSLKSYSLDEEGNIYFLADEKDIFSATQLNLFLSTESDEMIGKAINTTEVPTRPLVLSVNDQQYITGAYRNSQAKDLENVVRGIFSIPFRYDSDLNEIVDGKPLYFRFNNKLATEFNQVSNRKGTLDKKSPLDLSRSQENTDNNAKINAVLTDIIYRKDGTIIAILENQRAYITYDAGNHPVRHYEYNNV